MTLSTPAPTEIRLLKNRKALVVVFKNKPYQLSAELLRVESPSAEVQGHHPNQKKLIPGKKDITITGIEPRGNYAIQLLFSDGHHTGIYSWHYLQELAENQLQLWQSYLENLSAAGQSRTAP